MLHLVDEARLAERLATARHLASECRTGELTALLDELRRICAGPAGTLPADLEIEFAVVRATAAWNQERFDEARARLDQVVPRLAEASSTAQGRFHSRLGTVAASTGETDRAVDESVLAVAVVADDPPSPALAATLGSCALTFAQTQLFPLAAVVNEKAIETAAAIRSAAARFHIQAAHIQLVWGLRQDHLGVVSECRHRWEQAARHYDRAMTDPRGAPDVFVALAHAERSLGAARLDDPAGARRYLAAARETPCRPVPGLRRAIAHAEGAVLLAEGKYDEAAEILDALWQTMRGRLVPTRTEDVPLLLARALEAASRWDEALRWYREVFTRYGQAQYEMWQARTTAVRLSLEQDRLVRRNRQLESDAHADPLTGVANRRAFESTLPRLVADAHASATPLTMVVVDVDRFKQVNDDHGHPVGDEVLRRIARVLGASCRDADRCIRYGGDEFVLCLPVRAAEAAAAVTRITSAIAGHPWSDVSPGLAVTVTTGMAELAPGDGPAVLLHNADRSLLAAKRARVRPPARVPARRAGKPTRPVGLR